MTKQKETGKAEPVPILVVDDRPENISAAKKAGMRGIVYKNVAQFKRELKKYDF